MIVSASRRTDIPCFYADWFLHRLRAGYVLSRNPRNPSQISRISLTPDAVDCIVFWTKDPGPLLPMLPELDRMGYRYCIQFTLTPYKKELEPGLREKVEIEDTFQQLSRQIGKEKVFWRYDPIILNEELSTSYHRYHFERLCQTLRASTETVTISFVDRYAKLRHTKIREITREEMAECAVFLGNIAKQYGLEPRACCEPMDFTPYGIRPARCIDPEQISKICGHPLTGGPDPAQRPGCGCWSSVDVGAYHTCRNGCVYCYANAGVATVERTCAEHRPDGELLVGRVMPNDQVRDRNQPSVRRSR